MYNHQLQLLSSHHKKIILSGLGFMGYGLLRALQAIPGMDVVLLISRRPEEAVAALKEKGIEARVVTRENEIDYSAQILSVSSDLELISETQADALVEVTGTVAYATETALKALNSGKHLISMNPELQVTVGHKLLEIAQKNGLVCTDVIGDQPGSLSRLISHAQLMGFRIKVAGNMKRYMDHYATHEQMLPWAQDKGLAVRQTVSFTDGTKQAIEMNLVSNYFNMKLLKEGMEGPQVEVVHDTISYFKDKDIPESGVVDFALGKTLFPGVFVIASHTDPEQQKYLRYLNMGEGPDYLLFDPYHLCHLEAPISIANALLWKHTTIHNSDGNNTMTATIAKKDLKPGDHIDGIGGDSIRGDIVYRTNHENALPVGISEGCIVTRAISKDAIISISDVKIPVNAATTLLSMHS